LNQNLSAYVLDRVVLAHSSKVELMAAKDRQREGGKSKKACITNDTSVGRVQSQRAKAAGTSAGYIWIGRFLVFCDD
jgi:hypothetical protein